MRSLQKLLVFSLILLPLLVSCTASVPKIQEIQPRIGNLGEVLTITGSGFGEDRNDSYISIAGIKPTSSAYMEWRDNRIRVRIPEFGDSGLVYVHMDNKRSNPALFTNRESMPQPISGSNMGEGPRILSVEPASGRIGSLISISGRNFGASRDTNTVLFAWDSEVSPAAPAEIRSPSRIAVSEAEFGYELWSDREIRVRIPDGAVSGNLEVQTSRGTSIPVYFDITDRPGTKTYKEKRSYAVSYSVDIQVLESSQPNALYLWVPVPQEAASQRTVQRLSRNLDPFIENYRGTALYHFRDLTENQRETIRLSYLIDVYTVENYIRPQAIRQEASSPVRAAYTVPTALIPSDNEKIQTRAASIVGRERNPYLQARLIYQWMLAQLTMDPTAEEGSALKALEEGKADSYSAALLFCALSRALDIPANPVAGFLVDRSRNSARHHWAEFWIDGFGWIPVDPVLGSSVLPEILEHSFNLRQDAAQYYFGNTDNQRIAFSRTQIQLSQMDPRGRITYRERDYSIQNLWEEATGGLESYSSLWGDLVVTGVY